jgi:hypothetical protein
MRMVALLCTLTDLLLLVTRRLLLLPATPRLLLPLATHRLLLLLATRRLLPLATLGDSLVVTPGARGASLVDSGSVSLLRCGVNEM